jgi:peroxiredoxin (alkyl hydroperoxide reductase subunit C)
MSIRIGESTPDLALEAYVRGEPTPRKMQLSELQGRWVVLFFYPRDFTFVCPTEIEAFARLHEQFQKERTIVLGASTDSWDCHKAYFESDQRLKDVTYPIIADGSHKLSETFDVLLDDGRALRGTFIIDVGGSVRHILLNDVDVGRNAEETLRTLRALRTGELCPEAWDLGQATLTAQLKQEVDAS